MIEHFTEAHNEDEKFNVENIGTYQLNKEAHGLPKTTKITECKGKDDSLIYLFIYLFCVEGFIKISKTKAYFHTDRLPFC